MARYLFPINHASYTKNSTLQFFGQPTGGKPITDIYSVDGSNYPSLGIPRGLIVTDPTLGTVSVAGPDDTPSLYVSASGGARVLAASTTEAAGGDAPARKDGTTATGTWDFTSAVVNGASAFTSDGKYTPKGLYNATEVTTRRWRRALGRAQFIGSAHIAFFQDSIGIKVGGSNYFVSSDVVRTRAQSAYPAWTGGVPAQSLWFPANVTNLATVETDTGTWTAANKGIYEKFGRTSSTNGDTITWAFPAGMTETRIHYLVQPGGGTFKVTTSIGGFFGVQPSTAGTLAFGYTDFYSANGSVTATVVGAGSPVTLLGVELLPGQFNPTGTQATLAGIRNDGSQSVKVSRFSVSGMKTTDLVKNTDASSSLAFIDYIQPDLGVICLMTNDGDQQLAAATYQSQLDTAVARLQAIGADVLIVGAPPYQSDATNTIKLSSYVAAAKAVALSRGASFLDIPLLWGDWITSNAAGLMQDGLHPSTFGIPLLAQQIWGAVSAMGNQ